MSARAKHPISPEERSAHLAFCLLEIAEAQHALYMFRHLAELAKRGNAISVKEAVDYGQRACDRAQLALDSFTETEGGQP